MPRGISELYWRLEGLQSELGATKAEIEETKTETKAALNKVEAELRREVREARDQTRATILAFAVPVITGLLLLLAGAGIELVVR